MLLVVVVYNQEYAQFFLYCLALKIDTKCMSYVVIKTQIFLKRIVL